MTHSVAPTKNPSPRGEGQERRETQNARRRSLTRLFTFHGLRFTLHVLRLLSPQSLCLCPGAAARCVLRHSRTPARLVCSSQKRLGIGHERWGECPNSRPLPRVRAQQADIRRGASGARGGISPRDLVRLFAFLPYCGSSCATRCGSEWLAIGEPRVALAPSAAEEELSETTTQLSIWDRIVHLHTSCYTAEESPACATPPTLKTPMRIT